MTMFNNPLSRRSLLVGTAAGVAAVSTFTPTRFAIGQTAKIKIGLMLPYSGTYASLGNNITDAFKLRLAEVGGKLGGREVEFVQLDDESAPPKGKDNAAKLVTKDKVDILVGTVHSGVAMGMAAIAREENVLLVVPNAGAGDITGKMCAPNIFRTSFSNWQPGYACGPVMMKDGKKNVVTMTWNYPAGHEQIGGFKESYTAAGGKIVKEILLDFPKVEFQAYLTEIAALKPDAVFVFFSGDGAVKFIKDYAGAGLKGKIPLYATGFLTDGVLQAVGKDAEGIRNTLHYADSLDNPVNKKFVKAFEAATKRPADVFAVQGYDTCSLLATGLEAVKGDIKAGATLYSTMRNTIVDSPRGKFTFSASHNPIQDFYLREVRGGKDVVLGVAVKALADPAKGCSMV
ncbi:MAG: ABC transporter substrate-binding protein [Alphaproteobacteria bacterium]|nr:ABC transporter substrate-binding protein [Alphaproteobacteria bacterium]